MKKLIIAIACLIPTAGFADEAYEIRSRDHTCAEISQIIREHKKVFVRTGFAGRSFRSPPVQCPLGEMYTTARIRDANGQMCVLDHSCIMDPSSFYNRSVFR